MPSLNVETVLIGYFISNALIVAVLIPVWRRYRRRYEGLSLWLTSFVLQTVGMLLIALRGIAPDALSIVAAQLCTVSGALILFIGLEQFAGLRGPRFPNCLLMTGFLVSMIYFTFPKPDIQARTYVIFASLALLAGQSAWLMLKRSPATLRPVTRYAGLVFLAYLAVHLYRIVLTAALPLPNDFLRTPTPHTLGILLSQMLGILLTFTLVSMLAGRLLKEIQIAEITIQTREEALSETGRIARVGGWELDAVSLKETWTPEAAAIHDLDAAEETVVKSIMDFYRGESRRRIEEAVTEAVELRRPFELELEMTTARGNGKWIRTVGHPVIRGGAVTGIRASFQDITERRRLDEQIRSLSRFPAENPNPVLRIGRDGTLIYANAASEPILAMWNVKTGQSAPEDFKSWIDDAFHFLLNKEGEIRCADSIFHCRLTPISDEGYVNVYMRDVTEQRKAEEHVRKTIDRLNLATRAARMGIWDWDIQRNELIWDDRMYGLYGVRKEDFNGAYEAWLKCIHPEDRASSDEISMLARRGEREYDTEFRVVWPDGCIHHLQAYGFFVRNSDGEPIRMTGVNLDITERKHAEEALREANEYLDNLFNYANAPIIVWDPQFRVTRFNRAFESLTGRRAADVLGRSIELLFPPDRAEDSMNLIRKAADGERWETVEIAILRLDGSVRTVLWNSATIFAGDGKKPTATIAQGTDITERKRAEEASQRLLERSEKSRLSLLSILEDRKRAEEAVRELNAELERRVRDRTAQLEAANHELEAFSYSVSHDLRSPLRGIDGWSMALVEDYSGLLDGKATEYLGRIRHETARMDQLIDDLLRLSRVSRAELRPRTVDLTALAGRIAERLREANPGRAVVFEAEPDLRAEGDPALLEILLTNFLSNAWKFTGRMEKAEISFGRDGNGFFVRDNGAGFDVRYADRIFVPFQRMHRQSEFPGAGIGLAIVQRIAARHGGRVWAESEPDKGAAFYFTLGSP